MWRSIPSDPVWAGWQMAAGTMMDTLRKRRVEDRVIDVEVACIRYQTVLF